MSDSVWPDRWQPTRLLRPWAFPGKNAGVGCHFLLQCVQVRSESEVAQSCPTLSNPMDCSLPDSSIHESFQARVLVWVAIAFSVHLPYICINSSGELILLKYPIFLKLPIESKQSLSNFNSIFHRNRNNNPKIYPQIASLILKIKNKAGGTLLFSPLSYKWTVVLLLSKFVPLLSNDVHLNPLKWKYQSFLLCSLSSNEEINTELLII